MYAVTQPLRPSVAGLALPCGMIHSVTHRHRLQAVVGDQGLVQVFHCAVEAGVVEEGAPAVQHQHSRALFEAE